MLKEIWVNVKGDMGKCKEIWGGGLYIETNKYGINKMNGEGFY